MKKEENIKKITKSVKEMALGDVKRAFNGRSYIGAFMLGSCLIDCLTSLYNGRDSTPKDYREFILKFLTHYNPNNFYEDLRCKLVHNYSEGGSYIFIDGKPNHHLNIHKKSGKTIINLENFIEELEDVVDVYLQLLKEDNKIYKKAVKRYNKIGLLGIQKITLK